MQLIQVIFTGLLLFCSSLSFSANLVPIEFNGKKASYKANSSFIEIAPADANGISYNKFSQFEMAGENLKILNVSSEHQASIVVIEAPSLNLDAELNLIGSRAEILFITQNTNATINCTNCSFSGFTRVTLASAKFDRPYDMASSTLGTLNSSDVGNVNINNLDAPNALILDVIANHVSIDGIINLNQKVSKEPLGGVSADKNGKYILGGGSFHLKIGALKWDFDERKITASLTSAYPTLDGVTLNGELQSAEVKILSTKLLNLKTKIKTSADFIASASYRGDVLIPSNNITIITLPNGVVGKMYSDISGTTDLYLLNDIEANGSIVINSSGNLEVKSRLVNAENIAMNAVGDIYNEAHLKSNDITISGLRSMNRGIVEASNVATIKGRGFVSNEFGGQISAKEIRLGSGSLIRNGSRTPYISNHASITSRISDHKPVLNPSAIEHGMYYITDHDVTDKTKAQSISAHMSADIIKISTAAFENINPYYTGITYSDEFDLSPSATIRRDIINGVSISATKELTINAREYVYNSSAIIRVQSEDGTLSIKGGVLSNDRYRQLNLLSKSYKEVQKVLNEGNGVYTTTSYTNEPTKTTELQTRSYVYSPPGRIYSAGNLYAGPYSINSPSAVINNLGFIEVGKDATITSSTIKHKGLKHHRIAHISEAETAPQATGSVVSLEGCIGCSTTPILIETGKIIEEEKVLASRELNAFFSIGGGLYASEAAFSADNSSAFMDYVKAAIEHKVDSGSSGFDMNVVADVHFESCSIAGCYDNTRSRERDVAANFDDIRAAIDNEVIPQIEVKLVETNKVTSDWTGTTISETEYVVDQKTWSLFDTLNNYYEIIKLSILDAIQAVKDQLGWWD